MKQMDEVVLVASSGKLNERQLNIKAKINCTEHIRCNQTYGEC